LLFDQFSNDTLAEAAMKMIVTRKLTFSRSFHAAEGTNYYATNADLTTTGASAVIFHPVMSPNGEEVVGSASLLMT
jgi:hypothetical protein